MILEFAAISTDAINTGPVAAIVRVTTWLATQMAELARPVEADEFGTALGMRVTRSGYTARVTPAIQAIP